MKGFLVLEDGTIFQGEAFGAPAVRPGEVVFNTGMTGYQEVLTDPSYCGQIVCMTYPLIGNYGINPEDFESRRPFVRGFLVKELCTGPSHWQADRGLDAYLKAQDVPALAGIDTRALTKHLRVTGTMDGVLVTDPAGLPAKARQDLGAPGGLVALAGNLRIDLPPEVAGYLDLLLAEARSFALEGAVSEVTTPEPYELVSRSGGRQRVVVLDYGVKQNILRNLRELGCDVTVVPAATPADDILGLRPDGVLLSNGPGDPKELAEPIRELRGLIHRAPELPVFGICLGHQVLGLALGGDTFKLKFGHRGANHPVKDFLTGRVYITSQNHGYAVDPDTLPAGVTVTHKNLNDGTVEGLAYEGRPIWSVQYHPEAAPGPQESRYLFERFLRTLSERNGGMEHA